MRNRMQVRFSIHAARSRGERAEARGGRAGGGRRHHAVILVPQHGACLLAPGRGCAFVQARLAQGTVILSGSDSHDAGDVSVKGLTGASPERVAETPMVPPLARWGRTRALRSARQGACLRRALSESSPMPRGMAHGG